MKSMLVAAGAMLALVGLLPGPSEAAGCVKGAVVGGIAGHFVGHGLLGAGAGCAIGHHEAYRRDQSGAGPIAVGSGAGPIAAGIMTGEIPPDMGRAWRRVQVTDVE